MQQDMPVIAIRDVTKTYQMGRVRVDALRGVSLSVERGEMLSVMGPSGSGKSTMMNIIGCLDVPTGGRYFLEGEDVRGMNDNELAEIRQGKIGFVFQTYNLLPRATALANVEMPLMYGNGHNRRARALEALERVGLGIGRGTCRRSSPVANSSGWASRGRWSRTPRSCWRTSQRATWTQGRVTRSWQ